MTDLGTVHAAWREVFGPRPAQGIAIAPGRVNLIGEHTDYNDGFVMPMALDQRVAVGFGRRTGTRLRAHSVAHGETVEIDLRWLELWKGKSWSAYVAGTAWALAERGLHLVGMDLVIDGDVPLGAGLSSSAALEVAVARALCQGAELPWRPREIAVSCQRAENEFVGVECGVMDQMAAACSREGTALLLDCRTLESELVAWPDEATLFVIDSGVRRGLVSSAYNERRESCRRAVEVLRGIDGTLTALRDVGPELLEEGRDRLTEMSYRRALHVVLENERPRALAGHLAKGELEAAGATMDDSHASLRDLYEVSCPELEVVTRIARQHPACFGARLTGAGFGGSAIALVATDEREAFAATVRPRLARALGHETELFACRPAAGAHCVDSESAQGRTGAAAEAVASGGVS